MRSETTTSTAAATSKKTTTSTISRTTTKSSESGLLVLGLGSNLGASREILCWAVGELERFLGPLRVAPLYRSAPLSPFAQPDFYNTVVGRAFGATVVGRASGATAVGRAFSATPGPEDVLAFAKALELGAGRRRGARSGPRLLDVDLLLYGALRRDRPELTLPHPRLVERRFVLAPLSDLWPDLVLGDDEETVREKAGRLADGQRVDRVDWPPSRTN